MQACALQYRYLNNMQAWPAAVPPYRAKPLLQEHAAPLLVVVLPQPAASGLMQKS
jgi:hypothetical protein